MLPGLVVDESGVAAGADVDDESGGVVVPSVVEPVVAGAIVPVFAAGVADESDDVPVVDALPVEPVEPVAGADVESVDGAMVLDEVVPDEGVVAGLVVDVFDIELSVFGVSLLLQAPSAARVAARATHLIDRFTFTPRVCGGRRLHPSRSRPRQHATQRLVGGGRRQTDRFPTRSLEAVLTRS